MRESIVLGKAKEFAIQIVRLCQKLNREQHEFVLSKQCLRSGTSIGANLCEGIHGQSAADFVAKLHIALKEAYETQYWLELMNETNYISAEIYEKVNDNCIELIKLITSIINTTKRNISNNKSTSHS